MKGKVKFFIENKGYGFITCEDGTDVFFHVSGLIDKVAENDKVTFNTAKNKKGISAIDVKLLIMN